jgi:hypothetical protein
MSCSPNFVSLVSEGSVRGYPRYQEVSDVTYLLALIAVVAVAVLCWKAFGPEKSAGPTTPSTRSPQRKHISPQRKHIKGPDDDPEFLWRLSRQHRDGDSGSTGR